MAQKQKKTGKVAAPAAQAPAQAGGYRVARIGWPQENTDQPIILLDRKTRAAHGIREITGPFGSRYEPPMQVKLGTRKVVAHVGMQFRDLVNQDLAALNHKAAEALDASEGDRISIEPAPAAPAGEGDR